MMIRAKSDQTGGKLMYAANIMLHNIILLIFLERFFISNDNNLNVTL